MDDKEKMIEALDLSFEYSHLKNGASAIFKKLSFDFYAGQSVALLGANGCGKTTLILLLAAHLKPSSGEIFLKGRSLGLYDSKNKGRLISYAAQSHEISFNFNVFEVMAFGRSPYLGYFGFMKKPEREIILKTAEKFDLSDVLYRPFDELSGGEKKRVMLARAFLQDVPVAIFDEPEAHLDIKHQYLFYSEIKKMAVNENKLCIFSSHNVELALRYSTHVVLIDKSNGSFTFGPTDKIAEADNLKKIYGVKFERVATSTGAKLIAV